ncbi:MAG: hypothetical protein HOC70_03960 [Gammaproteobacteria bacterium]|jgi:uncharacterized protein|nr:hypothetical protein [Gammaproteobacteria bacterium]MBT4492375.1 hypothetical protein [Gammaproteobacteria bacterium]
MHHIPVRKMEFEIPTADNFDPKWAAGNIHLSYLTIAISLYVAYLEPFLVKALRRVLDRVEDPELKECVDRFCRQEAQHYQQHERFNEAILGMDYPGLEDRFTRLKDDFDRFLETKSERWCVGFVEGFEAYINQGALRSLKSGVFEHPQTDRRFGDLFKWHMTEEIEHRFVAYDIYQHLFGNYLYRVKMCFVAQWHIWKFIMDCVRIMSPVDTARYDSSYRFSPFMRAFSTVMIQPVFFRTYMPWYSPYRMKVPDIIQDYSKSLSESAKSVS